MPSTTISSDSAKRWMRDVADYEQPHARTHAIAALLTRSGCTSVTDIGCARGALRTLLPEGVAYHGVDFVNSLPPRPGDRFTSVDLNASELSPIEIDSEWVVCSGVLEYVRDTPRFLDWLKASATGSSIRLIITYFNETHISLRLRRLRGLEVAGHPDWVPLMARKTLIGRLREAGFEVDEAFDLTRDVRRSPSLEKLDGYRPRLYRGDRRSALLGHQWLILAELAKQHTAGNTDNE
jgi:hypothetical protein